MKKIRRFVNIANNNEENNNIPWTNKRRSSDINIHHFLTGRLIVSTSLSIRFVVQHNERGLLFYSTK